MIQVARYVNISSSDPSKAFVSCLLSILWGKTWSSSRQSA